jgi:Asp-tRNA(Asn)/Glu-tRNA(Gln) amidotransferase A subunit family amidase
VQVATPLIAVPAGSAFGLPVGSSFIGRAWSESWLIALAYAYEGSWVRFAMVVGPVTD